MSKMNFTIPIAPRSKKNHGQIITVKGRPMMIPSKQYLAYEKACKPCLEGLVETPIDSPINIKAIFYMDTKRKVDLVNLEQALCDVLVKYKVIADDNNTIIASMDGSRVGYDKENPRTEVEITALREKGRAT